MGVARRRPQSAATCCPTLPSVEAEITRAGPERWAVLASLFGRAFVTEPMMRWPLGEHDRIDERFVRCFEYFLEDLATARSSTRPASRQVRRSGSRPSTRTRSKRHRRSRGCMR